MAALRYPHPGLEARPGSLTWTISDPQVPRSRKENVGSMKHIHLAHISLPHGQSITEDSQGEAL